MSLMHPLAAPTPEPETPSPRSGGWWQRWLQAVYPRSPQELAAAHASLAVALNMLEPCFLSAGDTGERVRKLQIALKSMGFFTGAVDALFGDDTAVAIRSIQFLLGIDATGQYDPATWYGLTSRAAELLIYGEASYA